MKRTSRVLALAAAAAVILLAGYLWTSYQAAKSTGEAVQARHRADQTSAAVDPLVRDLIEACAEGGQAAAKLRAIGVCRAAADARDTIRQPGSRRLVPVPGPRGPGPSAEQVQAAVAAYCTVVDCSQGPTINQVRRALVMFCADGRCRGAQGQTGKPGRSGRDGINGQDAPPPSAAQLEAAVTAYCASRGGCRGPAGPQGDRGPSGQDGRDGAPGPTCPDGYTPEQRTVRTDQHPEGEQAVVCVATPAE